MNAAVFLDRDNTLIVNDGDLGNPDEVVLRNGVVPGLRALHKAGFRLVVVTNQGGVARGVYGEEQVDAVHQRIAELVSEQSGESDNGGGHLIDRFYYCPYHPEGTVERYRREHPWRKPAPGMLLQAASDLQVDLQRSWMIGDQVRDIDAGRAAGCRTVLLSDNEQDDAEAQADACVSDFESAVAAVLEGLEEDRRQAQAPQRPTKSTGPAPASNRPAPAAGTSNTGGSSGNADVQSLQRAMHDLCEELQSARQRRSEFTFLRMGAGMVQLGVLLCGLLGLLQLNGGDPWIFVRWMMGAVLLQCFAIFLLVADQR